MPVRAKRAVAALGMLVFLAFYIWAVIEIGGHVPAHWFPQLLFYGIAGTAWGLPLIPLMRWAEKDRKRG